MWRIISIFLLLSIIMGGCIREDMSDCGRLRLQFSYTRNKQGENLLSERVKDIRVYVFDGNSGIMAGMIRPGKQAILDGYIDVELPDGLYTFAVWGGGGEDLMQSGYLDAEITNHSTLAYTSPARTGSATLDNFRMMLACDPFSGSAAEEVIPKNERFDDLFFALAQDIEADRTKNRTVNLDFTKNTSTLKVRITGLSYLGAGGSITDDSLPVSASGQPVNVFSKGKNEIYKYDNHIDEYTPVMHNEPPYKTFTADVMDIDIRMQRLEIDRLSSNPVLLYVKDSGTGLDLISPLNIVEAILRVKDDEGNPVYRTQEDIDCEDEFPIEISILVDLSVSVSVNGFEIVDTTPEINKP